MGERIRTRRNPSSLVYFSSMYRGVKFLSLVARFITISVIRVWPRERLQVLSKCWQVSRLYVSVLWQAGLLRFVRGEWLNCMGYGMHMKCDAKCDRDASHVPSF